jgi:hypothetical protein|tara:strand:- start:3252 stop:3905 length:654 start_codon:yes stop_codon:yes gene_type:complete
MPKIIKSAKGTFTASNITVDSSGRVITASSGAGAANMIMTESLSNNTTAGTFTANPAANKIHLYLRGGGAGGGGGNPGPHGDGGHGGFGVWSIPISQPYAVPYSMGAGNALQPDTNVPGAAGGASTFDTNQVANGGNGGGRGPSPGNPGSPGNAPGSLIDFSQPTNALMTPYMLAFQMASGELVPTTAAPITHTGAGGPGPGGTGGPGGFKIFEDIG